MTHIFTGINKQIPPHTHLLLDKLQLPNPTGHGSILCQTLPRCENGKQGAAAWLPQQQLPCPWANHWLWGSEK